MLKYCSTCGRFHDINYIHQDSRRKKENKTNKFRATNAWREKSIEIRTRDRYLCQACLYGLTGPTEYMTEGLSVHHITPLSKEWDRRLDDENLITLCDRHHMMAEEGSLKACDLYKIIEDKYHDE